MLPELASVLIGRLLMQQNRTNDVALVHRYHLAWWIERCCHDVVDVARLPVRATISNDNLPSKLLVMNASKQPSLISNTTALGNLQKVNIQLVLYLIMLADSCKCPQGGVHAHIHAK